MFAEMGGKPAPMIALLNPDLVSRCVLIKNVEFTAKTKANTVNTPKGTFTGKSSDGESIKFITRLPVSAYAKGTYDVTGVVGYTVTITKEKTDEIGDITQKADTTITAVVYPVSMKAVTGGGEIEQPTEGATYVKAESVKAGEYLLAAGEFAFTPLADDKTFGYMPAKEVKLSGDSVNADAGYAITLIASDYVDSNSRAATTYYYMQDALGRYIYQKGTYNTFQLSATLPENIAEASWSVEIEYEGENPVVKITNAATGKYIQSMRSSMIPLLAIPTPRVCSRRSMKPPTLLQASRALRSRLLTVLWRFTISRASAWARRLRACLPVSILSVRAVWSPR